MLSNNDKSRCAITRLDSSTLSPSLDPKVIRNEIDLLAAAIHIDRYLMEAMNRLDNEFSEINKLAMLTFKQLSSNKHKLNDKVMNSRHSPSDEVTDNLEKITLYSERMEKKADTSASKLQWLCTNCDRSIDFYNSIIETSNDDELMQTAKALVSSALERSRILKLALGEECGCIGSYE